MKSFRQFLLERGERDTFARTEGLRIWRRLREILADKDLPETKYKWTSRGELRLYLPDLDHSFPSLYVVLDFASSGSPSGYGTVRGTNKPVIRIAKVLLNPYDWTHIETRMSGPEDTWVHEFTHYVDALDNPASDGIGTHHDVDNEEWIKRYYNHPSEVRAYTNELLFRLERFFNSRSPELRAHSREKAGRPDHVVQWLIGQSGTDVFKEWWKYLTDDNKRRVYKLIAAFLDNHKLSEAFLGKAPDIPSEVKHTTHKSKLYHDIDCERIAIAAHHKYGDRIEHHAVLCKHPRGKVASGDVGHYFMRDKASGYYFDGSGKRSLESIKSEFGSTVVPLNLHDLPRFQVA